jgi:TonB family protein
MARRTRELGPALLALGASLGVHLGLTAVGWLLPPRQPVPIESCWALLATAALPEAGEVEVEPDGPVATVTAVATRAALGLVRLWTWPEWLGGITVPRPDSRRAGRGGEDRASEPAVNLADAIDGIRLAEAIQTRIDRSQVRRFGADERRSSRENATLGPRPTSLLLLGMSGGDRSSYWSKALSDWPALLGVSQSAALAAFAPGRSAGALPAVAAAGATDTVLPSEPSPDSTGDAWPGAREIDPALTYAAMGIAVTYVPLDEQGPTPTLASDAVLRDRTAAGEAQGHAGERSAPGERRGPQSDTAKAAQEEASTQQSGLLASGAGGLFGAGVGGAAGPGAPGSGGVSGPGSVSRGLGNGPGASRGADPADLRRRSYIRGVLARVHPLWKDAFPRRAALGGKQGTTIIAFVIQADGSVGAASVLRPSGVPQFDDNCRRAVLRAAPFPPLPAELRPALSFQLPFVFENPAVRPPEFSAKE